MSLLWTVIPFNCNLFSFLPLKTVLSIYTKEISEPNMLNICATVEYKLILSCNPQIPRNIRERDLLALNSYTALPVSEIYCI